MRIPGQSSSRWRAGGSKSGFTLLETALSLVVLVTVALLVFSVADQMIRRSQCRQWAEDWKGFAAAFADYRDKNGRWPDASGELGEALPANWQQASPFGGEYEWQAPGEGRETPAIRLMAFHPHQPLTCTRDDLLELDRIFDDGDLASGRFRAEFNGWPVYRFDPQP